MSKIKNEKLSGYPVDHKQPFELTDKDSFIQIKVQTKIIDQSVQPKEQDKNGDISKI